MNYIANDIFWDNDALVGLSGAEIAERFGIELEPDEGSFIDGCFNALVAGDPYSQLFTLFGDGTLAGSVVVGVQYNNPLVASGSC